MTDLAIETHGLTKDYGNGRGIFDLDLAVGRGEAFGFIGPNGAGKTTTIRLLMDLIRPTRGTARVLGRAVERDGVSIRRLTGFVPGEAPEYPNHTGGHILDMLAHLHGGVPASRISELAARLDLDLRRKYREYSHGNKQKVWLVQAFMHAAELFILDEPTTGLDPLMQQTFRELLEEARTRGATIFLSSHVLPEVQELCDRIGVVHSGALRRVGTLDELRLSHVRRVAADVADTANEAAIKALAGVSDVSISDHHVTCTVSGDMQPLLSALASAHILGLDSSEMSLEEVFLSQYGQADKA